MLQKRSIESCTTIGKMGTAPHSSFMCRNTRWGIAASHQFMGVLLAACSTYDDLPTSSFQGQPAPSSGGHSPSSGSAASNGISSNGGSSNADPAVQPAAGSGSASPVGGNAPISGSTGSQSSAGDGSASTSLGASGMGASNAPGSDGGAPALDAGASGQASQVDSTEGGDGFGPVAPAAFRYVKLLALSEQNGLSWTSIAELQVLTVGGKPLDSVSWSARADSEETSSEYAPAKSAIDRNPWTYWHVHWTLDQTPITPLPHYLIVDLGTPKVVTGFTYLPRQDGRTTGNIKDWALYLSTDGSSWAQPVRSGSFPPGAAPQTVIF